jgi:ABC-type multidrug transport system ATPase subunit
MTQAVLEARDISKAYRRHHVLRGVNLTACPAQLVAVVGENDAGKSTLLKILAAALAADRGQVRLTRTLGYCPQDPVLVDSLTVGQHLRYYAAAHWLTLALLHDPDVQLLDEPYQGLDWETYLRFWDLAGDLRARRKTIVIITDLVSEQDRFDLLEDLAGGHLNPRHPAAREDDHARR